MLVPARARAVTAPGELWNWGANAYGQLGDGSFSPHRTPEPIPGLGTVHAAEGGREHALALTPGGVVYAWGWNLFGQVGSGSSASTVPTPASVLTDVIDIGAGHYSSFAVKSDGTAWAWGRNETGQLGDGTSTTRRVPTRIQGLAGHTIVDVAGGRNHAMALADDGSVFTWGSNRYGQLGDGTFQSRLTPVPAEVDNIVRIFAGRDHSLAVQSNGAVWAWGHNRYGQVGDGTLTNRSTPQRVTRIAAGTVQLLDNIVDVDAGGYHSLARTASGRLWVWGWNDDGQLGDGTVKSRRRAVRVKSLTGVLDMAGGRQSSIAVVAGGDVYAWGENQYGQLGDGTTSQTGRITPGIVPGISDVGAVGMGRDYAMAVVVSTGRSAGS